MDELREGGAVFEEEDDEVSTVIGPDGVPHPDTSPHRSNSLPPLPPPSFNPPADYPPSSPSSTVSPPGSEQSSATTSLSNIHDVLGSGSLSSTTLPGLSPTDPRLPTHRPELRALQRVSYESASTPGGSVSSNQSTSSDSAEHLQEMREKLLLESGSNAEGTGSNAGGGSRRNSISSGSGSGSGSGGQGSGGSNTETFEFHITNPTPPLRPAMLASYSTSSSEAGPSRRRRSSTTEQVPMEGTDLPLEHAWDSVWPAPGSMHRSGPEPGPSRFPTAPMSPFVTPSFSPSVMPQPSSSSSSSSSSRTQKMPSPPTQRRSPRLSPRRSPNADPVDYLFDRRHSITSTGHPFLAHSPPSVSPIAITTQKHQRSGSQSSQHSSPTVPQQRSLTQEHHSGSPPKSPMRKAVPIPPTTFGSGAPGSPTLRPREGAYRRHMPSLSLSGAGGPSRLADLGASSPEPPSLLAAGRPRGKSLSTSRSPMGLLPLAGIPALPTMENADEPSTRGDAGGEDAQSQSHTSSRPVLPPASWSAIALPSAITTAPAAPPDPVFPSDPGPAPLISPRSRPLSPPVLPTFLPSARPGILRRAMSDYDPKAASNSGLRGMTRSISVTTELDKSPKRSPSFAELRLPLSPGSAVHADQARFGHSPKVTAAERGFAESGDESWEPSHSNPEQSTDRIPSEYQSEDHGNATDLVPLDTPMIGVQGEFSGEGGGSVALVDEGDVLPSMDFQMDVTFDDEGLNTLERIFLLSKSEYAFHRSYVARVLGDLLADVDPCESVEYVLPLLSGFSVDEDESVKEAFASELHRILWYFYVTCKLVDESGGEMLGERYDQTEAAGPSVTMTVTENGVEVVPTPTIEEVQAEATTVIIPLDQRRDSIVGSSSTGASSAGSSLYKPSTVSSTFSYPPGGAGTAGGGELTPASTVAETPSSAGTAFSPGEYVNPYTDDTDPEKGWAKDVGPLVDRPQLAINFFTPLLGSLLLNQNPAITEAVRGAVVNILARLRGKGEVNAEMWGAGAAKPEPDERRTFASQNGPHAHDLRPFSQEAKHAVEMELINGIVIGMGGLSTDMPDLGLFEHHDAESQTHPIDEVDSEGFTFPPRPLPHSGSTSSLAGSSARAEQEAFHAQLIQEATAGRATSMNLIGQVCEYFSGEEVVEKGFFDEILACGDGDVPVRAEGAVALSSMAKIVPADYVPALLPLFELFLNDPVEHVRESATLALAPLCRRIEDSSQRRDFAVNAVQVLTEESGEEVRCAALEMLGEVIYVFDKDPQGPPFDLLKVYMDDVGVWEAQRDADWDIVAAFNFPGVCLTLGPDRWHELLPLYQRLQHRAGEKVLRTLAASLHELAKVLRPAQVQADLLPVYHRCLESNDEVRQRVYEHLDDFLANLPAASAWQTFLELATAWSQSRLGGWRAREQLALHMPAFFKLLTRVSEEDREVSADREAVLSLMRGVLLDPFAAVREAATHGIPKAYEVLSAGSDAAKRFRETLLELGNSSAYRQRLTFVRCLRQFCKPPPNRHAFEEFFLPFLPRLSHDVVDVRLGLAQIIADLFVIGAFYGEDTVPTPRGIRLLAEQLAADEAVDVRDTVRNIDLARVGKGKARSTEVPGEDVEVPYHARPHLPDSRASGPGQVASGETLDDLSPEESGSGSLPSSSRTSISTVRPTENSHEVAAKLEGMKLGLGGLWVGSAEDAGGESSATPKVQRRHGLDPFDRSFGAAVDAEESAEE